MAEELQGHGAGAEDILVRRGKSWESVQRLEAQAEAAEKAGSARNGIPFGHGVSVTSQSSNDRLARDPGDCVSARRRIVEEAGFEVRYTPTRKDPDHHTVALPKPMTDEIAAAFNTVFGRTRKRN